MTIRERPSNTFGKAAFSPVLGKVLVVGPQWALSCERGAGVPADGWNVLVRKNTQWDVVENVLL